MTAPPPLPSAGRADRARRAASTVDPSNPIRPGPRSCPRRAGHGQRPRPRTREPNGPRRCMWAISVPCALPDRIMRMGQWATCRTDHAAHAKAHVRAGIADHPDGPRSIRRTNQIRGPRESPCGDGHADHPWSMDRAGRWRPRPPGHGPRTIWAGVLLQCLFDRFGSVFPQCGLMVFPGVVIVSR